MTCEDVLNHLLHAYNLDDHDRSSAELSWRFADGDWSVTQQQRVSIVQALGRDWVLIVAKVADEHEWTTRDAVTHNGLIAIGSLALERSEYVVRQIIPAHSLTEELLDSSLEVVAQEAATLRRRITGTRGSMVHPTYVE